MNKVEELETLTQDIKSILKNLDKLKESKEYVGTYISRQYLEEVESIIESSLYFIKLDKSK